MKKKTKIIIFIGIFLALVVVTILLLQMLLLEEHTGIITNIDNNIITFEEKYPIDYSYTEKESAKIYDQNGNAIDPSKLAQGDEVYIYKRGTNELQAGTVKEIGDSEITISTYYSLLYNFSTTDVSLKDNNGNIVNLYDLNIGDTITVKSQNKIISYDYPINTTVKNLKNVKTVIVYKSIN